MLITNRSRASLLSLGLFIAFVLVVMLSACEGGGLTITGEYQRGRDPSRQVDIADDAARYVADEIRGDDNGVIQSDATAAEQEQDITDSSDDADSEPVEPTQ